jgi:CheY-like chemotaxis protein
MLSDPKQIDILVAEDDPTISKILKKKLATAIENDDTLKEYNLNIRSFTGAKAAYAEFFRIGFENYQLDLAILDNQMPTPETSQASPPKPNKDHGIELIKSIRSCEEILERPPLSIIMHSSDKGKEQEAQDAGANAFIGKGQYASLLNTALGFIKEKKMRDAESLSINVEDYDTLPTRSKSLLVTTQKNVSFVENLLAANKTKEEQESKSL